MEKYLEELIIEYEHRLNRPLKEIEIKVLEFLIHTDPDNSDTSFANFTKSMQNLK
ncbi:hypothetical protein JCM9157_3864 [Halalkalibacter akibai JCM 9157]|uniref:Uncharacterized protein n=1 Tax=Halalkalibacter akibai (strain ATCC 43226 / DSM 21942 / CIP 109018 / JCM 9157 / 1139) TaxID=1236973 RepID=W4QZB8_HALA3|nr:hypothetical protein JCM9157_3864 [Halalkalibacter akibai JCM 9157]